MTKEELITLLDEMDLPPLRKDLSNLGNVRWLMRNIHIRNGDHPRLNEVFDALVRIWRNAPAEI